MDPTACLREIRALIREFQAGESIEIGRFVDLVESLDRWITGGGFLPRAWDRAQAKARAMQARTVTQARLAQNRLAQARTARGWSE